MHKSNYIKIYTWYPWWKYFIKSHLWGHPEQWFWNSPHFNWRGWS